MTADARWRSRARELLYNYTTYRELLRRGEQEVILGQGRPRDHRYRRGGVTNPTQAKALLLDTAERRRMERAVRAVELLTVSLKNDGRRHRLKALDLLELVYIRHSHSLFYAALELEISDRTAKRMNSELLSFVAREMGWLEPAEAERFNAPAPFRPGRLWPAAGKFAAGKPAVNGVRPAGTAAAPAGSDPAGAAAPGSVKPAGTTATGSVKPAGV